MTEFIVEIAYALPDKQYLIPIRIVHGTTVQEAILASGILKSVPEINLHEIKIGIFSKPCTLQTILKPHDRIELYRPLLIDPKLARRAKAKKIKK